MALSVIACVWERGADVLLWVIVEHTPTNAYLPGVFFPKSMRVVSPVSTHILHRVWPVLLEGKYLPGAAAATAAVQQYV